MERGSAQHGARIDDELAHESDGVIHSAAIPSREREDLDPEALTADEEDALVSGVGGAGASDGEAPVHADLIARSELARWLLPSAFPASGAILAQVALGQGAPDALPEQLEALGADPVFDTVGELWIALGGAHEERESAPNLEPVVAVADIELEDEDENEAEDAAEDATADVTPIVTPPVVTIPRESDGWAQASPLTPLVGEGLGLVAGSIVRLVTLPPRVAIGVAHSAAGVVGRGLAALTGAHRTN